MEFIRRLFTKKVIPKYVFIGSAFNKDVGLTVWVVDANAQLAEKQLRRLFRDSFGDLDITRIEVLRLDLRYHSTYNFEIVGDFIEAIEN